MRCIILQRKFRSWGASLPPISQSIFLIMPITHLHMGRGECGTLGKSESPDKLQSTNRCTHTEMETIERQRHEVIALINVLYPRRGLLNHQWHVVRTVRAFCFFTLMGCFDQRPLGSSEEQGCGKRQLAGLEEPFLEPRTKTGRGIRRAELVLNRITDLDSSPPIPVTSHNVEEL